MTRMTILAGISAALISLTVAGASAQAACSDTGTCAYAAPHKSTVKKKVATKKLATRKLSSRKSRSSSALAVVPGGRGPVVAMIKAQAPRYGVPTWFALRIAQIESGYNPRAHGAAGEIGVFQLKCATARGLGFRGGCGGLYNASTNIHYGLKHLQLAVRSSGGNLKLAASKHNGGLGRKKLVKKYVNRVF